MAMENRCYFTTKIGIYVELMLFLSVIYQKLLSLKENFLEIHILIFPLPMVMVVGLSKVKDTMNCLVHLKIGVEKTVL